MGLEEFLPDAKYVKRFSQYDGSYANSLHLKLELPEYLEPADIVKYFVNNKITFSNVVAKKGRSKDTLKCSGPKELHYSLKVTAQQKGRTYISLDYLKVSIDGVESITALSPHMKAIQDFCKNCSDKLTSLSNS